MEWRSFLRNLMREPENMPLEYEDMLVSLFEMELVDLSGANPLKGRLYSALERAHSLGLIDVEERASAIFFVIRAF